MTKAKQTTIGEATEGTTEVIENETEPTTTEMVEHQDNTALAVPQDADTFLQQSHDNQEDDGIASLPRLKVGQKGDEAGKLVCEEMAEAWDTMPMVLLKKTNSRRLWPEKYNKDNALLCKSHDGIVPFTDQKDFEPMARDCKSCKYSQWSREKGKKATPPRCQEVFDLMLLDYDSMIPMWLSVHSTGLSPAKNNLLKPLKLRMRSLTSKRAAAGNPPAHSCMYKFTLGTLLKENEAGDAYIPTFENLEELPDNDKTITVQVAIATAHFEANFAGNRDDDGGAPKDESDHAFDEETDSFQGMVIAR